MAEWFTDKLCGIAPTTRRKIAVYLLIWSFVLGHLNIAAFVGGFVSHTLMDVVTNYLSWLALTLTALDVVIGTDVRVEQED